jgi:hypothetical protein
VACGKNLPITVLLTRKLPWEKFLPAWAASVEKNFAQPIAVQFVHIVQAGRGGVTLRNPPTMLSFRPPEPFEPILIPKPKPSRIGKLGSVAKKKK